MTSSSSKQTGIHCVDKNAFGILCVHTLSPDSERNVRKHLIHYSPVRVKNGATSMLFTGNGFIVDQRQIVAFLQRSVESRDGDNCSGGVDA